MDFIVMQFTAFNEYAKANPVVGGLVSLWGLSVLTYLLRNVPMKIWGFVSTQITTTLTVNNSQVGTNQVVFNNLSVWLSTSRWAKFSRSLAVDGQESTYIDNKFIRGTSKLGAGIGTHFFFHKGRLYWAQRSKMSTASSTNQVFYEIVITMLGRNHDKLLAFYNEFNPPPAPENLGIYTYNRSAESWSRLVDMRKRDLRTVITPDDLMERLIKLITRFKGREAWYLERGLSYKLVVVLYGSPGTGKTSIIKSLASHFNVDLGLLPIESMGGTELRDALANAEPGSFLLCEDFEGTKSLRKRKGVDDVRIQARAEESEDLGEFSPEKGSTFMATLSEILNAFDGVVSLHNKIVFLTTNKIDDVDPAFLRPGRVDHVIEVGYLQHDDICRYVNLMFPDAVIPQDVRFATTAGCVVQQRYMAHSDSIEELIDALPKVNQDSHTTLRLAATGD